MYTTKPLSLFKSNPPEDAAAVAPPPEGRNSGYLVVKGATDDERCFFGLFPDRRVRELPFPQDRVLKVRYTVSTGDTTSVHEESVVFVPVPDQPLSSNRYYAVVAKGKRRGLVRACSREDDMATCCFARCVRDVEPRPFDPADVYQQIQIVRRSRGWFTAKAVSADGFPSSLFRHKYWEVYASKTKKFDLGEALGVDAALRSRQLLVADAVVPAAAAAVGRWYAPFFLIKEDGVTPREQMERSAFYEVRLELSWEPVHALGGGGSKLASKKALIGGSVEAKQEAYLDYSRHRDAYVWFKAAATGQRLGVCTTMWERMQWEQNRGGWVDEEDAGKVAGAGGTVLVEKFVVRRLDGSVVVAFDFVHFNKVRAKQV